LYLKLGAPFEQVLVRAIKLYALGLFVNNGARVLEWRVLGVLQVVGRHIVLFTQDELILH
jgi:hypothetical protein